MRGAGCGALFGVALLGVGVIRLVVALVTGKPIDLDEFGGGDRILIFVIVYCGSFAAAGAALSALWPLRRSRPGAYLLGYLGAAIVCSILGGLMMWLEDDYDLETHAVVVGIMTLIFGTFAGFKIQHWDRI